MNRPSIQRTKISRSPMSNKMRHLDLRRVERYCNFGACTLTYHVQQGVDVNLTTHFDSPQQNIDFTKDCLTTLLTEVISDVMTQGFDDRAITHIFMHFTGLDQDFKFNDSGEDGKTLSSFHIDPNTIKQVVDKFSKIIQSGKPVILDGRTTIRVCVYEPPKTSNQTLIPQFIGSGHGQNTAIEAYSVDELVGRCHGIVKIKNDDHLCMPRAIAVCVGSLNKNLPGVNYNNIRDSSRTEQKNAALQICELAHVDPSTPCTYDDLLKFSKALNINIEVYKLHHTFFDKVASSQIVDNRPDIFLMYSPIKKHFDAITNIDAVARSIKNNRRTYCKECRKFITPMINKTTRDKGWHKCFREDKKLYIELNNEVVHYMPDYSLMEEESDISCDGFIALNSKEEEAIPLNKVWYFDFETTVVGTHRETMETEELQFDDEFHDKLREIDTHNYQPLPFQPRVLDTDNYDYQQVVNYVEIQSADGYVTLRFRTIDAFASFLQRKELKGAYLIAHYGQGFDFQLLYQYMFRADGVMHGKIRNPVMRGNKIVKGFIFNNITLIDSYSYISQGLADFPKMFELQELRKGFFPHLLNIKPFWNYIGPIPDKEWYG